MKRLYRIFNHSLTSTPIDLWLLRLAGWSIGVGVLAVVAVTLPRHAANQTELLLGLGLAALNCLIALMWSALSVRVNTVALAVKMHWRSRMWEWCTYPAGLAILSLGMWFTATLPLARAGFMIAFLLILALTLAAFCVGLLLTLIRQDFLLADSVAVRSPFHSNEE